MKKILVSLILVIVIIGSLGVPISARFISHDSIKADKSFYATNWYEDSQLSNGLWYQDINNPIVISGYQVSFMKIYSGLDQPTRRVMELSTYPRAYVDKDPHVYTVDTPFVVSQDDLNDYYNSQYAQEGGYQYRPEIEDGTNVFVDTYQLVFLIGETATHYAGDPLPGNFPMWIESESLPTPSWVDQKDSVFPYVFQAVKGQLVTVTMYEGYYRESTQTTWTKIPTNLFNTYSTAFASSNSEVRVTKIVKNKDRTILRLLYDRTR